MRLEFTIRVEPDEHGVFDGRELARQLIGNAYRLLVPYVRACPLRAGLPGLLGQPVQRHCQQDHRGNPPSRP